MLQPFLFDLSRSIVKDRDLLKPRMKITPYNQHWRWLLSRALVCSSHTNLLATSQRRYAINRSRSERDGVAEEPAFPSPASQATCPKQKARPISRAFSKNFTLYIQNSISQGVNPPPNSTLYSPCFLHLSPIHPTSAY